MIERSEQFWIQTGLLFTGNLKSLQNGKYLFFPQPFSLDSSFQSMSVNFHTFVGGQKPGIFSFFFSIILFKADKFT